MATPWVGSLGTEATGRPLAGVGLRSATCTETRRFFRDPRD